MILLDFLSGAVVLSFLVCSLFFLRYWSRTRDELFISFAIAFALLAIAQTVLALASIPAEDRGPVYLIRLSAFILILFAIFRKNRLSA